MNARTMMRPATTLQARRTGQSGATAAAAIEIARAPNVSTTWSQLRLRSSEAYVRVTATRLFSMAQGGASRAPYPPFGTKAEAARQAKIAGKSGLLLQRAVRRGT